MMLTQVSFIYQFKFRYCIPTQKHKQQTNPNKTAETKKVLPI